MNNIKVKVNRFWHGFVSVRNHILDKAKRESKGLEIWVGSEYIVVPYSDLDRGMHNKEEFVSRHDGKKYHLVDFDWKEYKVKKAPEQITFDLFSSLQNYNHESRHNS